MAPAAGQTNTLAIISLVAGIGSFFAHVVPGVGGFTVALVAVITGHLARGQIKKTGEGGMGMATAGLIIGYVHLALIGLVVLLVVVDVGRMTSFSTGVHRSSGVLTSTSSVWNWSVSVTSKTFFGNFPGVAQSFTVVGERHCVGLTL